MQITINVPISGDCNHNRFHLVLYANATAPESKLYRSCNVCTSNKILYIAIYGQIIGFNHLIDITIKQKGAIFSNKVTSIYYPKLIKYVIYIYLKRINIPTYFSVNILQNMGIRNNFSH